MNLAVGIIGTKDNPANLMYGGVLAVGIISFSMFRFAGDPVNQIVSLDTSAAEREAVLAIPFFCQRLTPDDVAEARAATAPSRVLREAMLELLFASGSDILLLPIQDLFGWRDRINQPATVSDGNWTWRLPWPSDRLVTEPDAMAMASQLREWSRAHGRL